MKEEKNIDELFKKSFQDFEATPSPEVWDHIEAALKKRKERKESNSPMVETRRGCCCFGLATHVWESLF